MAIEPPDELVTLQRAAHAARAEATAQPYSPEAWQPWLDAAEAVYAAVTAYATEHNISRYNLEQAVRTAARADAETPPEE